MVRRNWTKEEVLQALALYLRLDFGKFHNRNPSVIKLAQSIGRTPSAVALKLTNLAALDESLPQKGMANASALDRSIWKEFLETPEVLVSVWQEQMGVAIEDKGATASSFAERAAYFQAQQDTNRVVPAVQRAGQSFFREMILTSYGSRCALTGNEDTRLLNASHIVGWAEDRAHRLDPTNGICLNALHDRAFDKHLITFDDDFRMQIAADVPPHARRALEKTESARLVMPSRFLPSQAFLERHRRNFHARQSAI